MCAVKKNDTDLNLTPIDEELEKELLDKEQAEDFAFEIKLGSRRDERNLAFYLLYSLDRFDYAVLPVDALKDFEKGFDIKIPEDSYAASLVKGVVEYRGAFDKQLGPYLRNWRLERLGCCTKIILYIALWELSQPQAIPSIVINEAIELAKTFAEKDSYRFVNGILDEIAKTLKKGDVGCDETKKE